MNAHQAASDWDYQDALHPQRAAYDAWCEAYLVEALKSDEIETAFSAHENLESEFDALVMLLAFSAAEFQTYRNYQTNNPVHMQHAPGPASPRTPQRIGSRMNLPV